MVLCECKLPVVCVPWTDIVSSCINHLLSNFRVCKLFFTKHLRLYQISLQILSSNLKVFLDPSKKVTYKPPISWIKESFSEPDPRLDASLAETVSRNLKRKSMELKQPFKKKKFFDDDDSNQSFSDVAHNIDYLYKTIIEEKQENEKVDDFIYRSGGHPNLQNESYANLEDGIDLLKSALEDEKLGESILTQKLQLFSQ